MHAIRPAKFPEDETCFARLPWFAPKPLSAYDVWTCPDDRQCIVLTDRTTREAFVAACQL